MLSSQMLGGSPFKLSASPLPKCVAKGLSSSQSRRAIMVPPAQAASKVVSLDFDGVVCDSVGESSLSAIKAATVLWPDVFDTPAAKARHEELVEKMRIVRPVVETGYENLVQIRCLLEGMSPEEILSNWGEILPKYMQHWGLERAKLVELFGGVRDDWIASDLPSWLGANRIYQGVADPVREALAQQEVYIVTTKQAHFTEILMRDMAKVDFPADRIFSQTVSGRPKAEVLQMLTDKHAGMQKMIFVEDKLSTLEKVAKDPKLEGWELYLVDWGYNTVEERARASQHPRIHVISTQQFADLLQR
ncbi:hypothetical protein DUNSADRAFT_7552 [Dunaliella salina]|uniref:Uncharacterized protein n=1 Tax=Dunaliella salina TaxID=3046 RepID=A0ABQ7GL35_DUNSA|nr:hypothetical protein DUNSADRAFT_7552 [Dunaliella salina]|eukprot:KAF5835320.1 hypothetical protein DUNSADRAFT_7552 [Dunaliella salina]